MHTKVYFIALLYVNTYNMQREEALIPNRLSRSTPLAGEAHPGEFSL